MNSTTIYIYLIKCCSLIKQIQLILLFAYPSTDVARNEKQSNHNECLCWMDAWHCLKASTGQGGLALGVKVSGQ